MQKEQVGLGVGLYSYLEFGACVLAFLPMMALSSARHRNDPTQRAPGRWMRRLGWLTSRLTPLWDFGVEGEGPPDILEKPYVVVANHESTADPFLLTYLPWDMRWVAKEELFKVPIIGLAFRWSGDIPLRRGEGDSVRQMMDACKTSLDAGIPIMMFPEGTRSKHGELLPFRDGAFRLAIEAGVPILPLAIAGTKEARPKGSKWFGRARARVRVLSPISTRGLGLDDVAALRERTRDAIAAALPGLRKSVGVERGGPRSVAEPVPSPLTQ
ncbi:MAG: 1-acyl-sn-glycerol-3-phosphate acyltransferase [Polyangiaceae bacterium]|nr:1-acyl-sn-glycerol-3-phosphate acyltransferase [Polyangiaceae bacterium]